ncbi:MAG: hypothetical protein M3Q47_19205 [Actinomycetota bacterium]|nr:hypothetical protein [Actinomycetota bacterium]
MPPSSDGRPESALRRHLDRLPPGRRRALMVGLLVVTYLLNVWVLSLVDDDPADWFEPLPGLLGGFGGAYLGVRLQRRRLGGRERVCVYERALRTGRLPEDTAPALWRPLLERELQVQRKGTRAVVWVVGVLVLCWVLIAVLYDIALVWWLLAVLGLVLFAAFLRWAADRQTRRIRRLLDEASGDASAGIRPPAG